MKDSLYVFLYAPGPSETAQFIYCSSAEAERFMEQIKLWGEFYCRDVLDGPDSYRRIRADRCRIAEVISEFEQEAA